MAEGDDSSSAPLTAEAAMEVTGEYTVYTTIHPPSDPLTHILINWLLSGIVLIGFWDYYSPY